MASLVILDEPKLRQLARIIYLQEAEATQNTSFNSEHELATFLRECKANYDSVISLLDAALELKTQFEHSGDQNLASIANNICTYVEYAVNSALQTVPNYSLRKSYLEDITRRATSLSTSLKELDPRNESNVLLLAKQVVESMEAMLDYIKKFRSAASTDLSKWIKVDTGVTFPDPVKTYQKNLDLDGPFKDVEKLQLYEEIWSRVPERFSRGGPLVLLSKAGASIIGAFAGWLTNLTFGSRGSAPLSTEGHQSYTTPLPNGIALAYQISHQETN